MLTQPRGPRYRPAPLPASSNYILQWLTVGAECCATLCRALGTVCATTGCVASSQTAVKVYASHQAARSPRAEELGTL